jgi:hypothetical protein
MNDPKIYMSNTCLFLARIFWSLPSLAKLLSLKLREGGGMPSTLPALVPFSAPLKVKK